MSGGWYEDELGWRTAAWFTIAKDDIEAARRELGVADVNCARVALRKHTNTKWCERFGWPCDEEGYSHTHWEFVNGEPTHVVYWRQEDVTPTETKETQ